MPIQDIVKELDVLLTQVEAQRVISDAQIVKFENLLGQMRNITGPDANDAKETAKLYSKALDERINERAEEARKPTPEQIAQMVAKEEAAKKLKNSEFEIGFLARTYQLVRPEFNEAALLADPQVKKAIDKAIERGMPEVAAKDIAIKEATTIALESQPKNSPKSTRSAPGRLESVNAQPSTPKVAAIAAAAAAPIVRSFLRIGSQRGSGTPDSRSGSPASRSDSPIPVNSAESPATPPPSKPKR